MCQTIPRPVLRIGNRGAEVLYDGEPVWVSVHGIPDLAVGEYLAVYAGQALDRIPADEAEAMLAFYAELDAMFEEAVEHDTQVSGLMADQRGD